jgi:hypothetical protein
MDTPKKLTMNDRQSLSYIQSREVVYGSPGLSHAVMTAMLHAGINDHHELCGRCERAAAQLYVSGWFAVRVGQLTTVYNDRTIVRHAIKDARQQLMQAGIIPASIIWWVRQWKFRSYLRALIGHMLFGDEG